MNKQRLLNKIIIVIALLVLCVFFIVSCDSNVNSIKGITVLDNEDEEITESGYSEELQKLISDIVKAKIDSVPVSITEDIKAFSDEADSLLKSYKISNKKYVDLRNDLKSNERVYSSAIVNIIKDVRVEESIKNIKSLFSTYVSTLGNDGLTNYVYDLCKFRLNYDYLQKKASFEKTGMKKAQMEEALHDYNIFVEDIDKKEFKSLISSVLIVIDLATNSSVEGGFSLTSSEIEKLIKIPKFSNKISVDGWTLILKKIGGFTSNSTYYGALFERVIDNGDLGKFAEKSVVLVNLLDSIQDKMTEDIIDSLSGGIVDILYSLIPILDDEEWGMLEDMFDLSINSNYWQVGYDFYGNEFLTYKNSVTLHTVQELKTATRENVGEIVEGIIASISPAFSYRWNNDWN